MTIASKALKFDKFKSLIAYTAATTSAFLPAASLFFIAVSLPKGVLAGTVAMGALLVQLIPSFVFVVERDTKFIQHMRPGLWKNLFNLLPEHLQKKENEKIILMLREWRSTDKLNERQIKEFANYMADLKLHTIEANKWANIIERDFEAHSLNPDFLKVNTKNKETNESAQLFLKNNPLIQKYVEEIIQDKIKSSSMSLRLKDHYDTYVAQGRDYDYHSRYHGNIYIEHNSFLFSQPAYPTLKPDDYKQLQIFARKEAHSLLDEYIKIFESHPEKVDWLKLSIILKDNYKNHSDWYQSTQTKLERLAGISQERSTQEKLQSNAAALLANIQQGKTTEGSAQKEAPEAVERFKRCDYVDYKATFFPEKWAEIKECYDTIMKNSDKFDAEPLRDLHYVMNACLPSLILTDGNLKAVPQAQSQQAKDLILYNLDLISNQVKTVLQNLDDKNIKSLEVIKTYQHMKMGKS